MNWVQSIVDFYGDVIASDTLWSGVSFSKRRKDDTYWFVPLLAWLASGNCFLSAHY